ncbi:MAG TPA: GNAT family N-acetyltransferase [Chloroflexia bacterium]|jgi:GNAT superfamily N-acetyltransferase|nr:GNAT family N-acetyltransferase [Chloroflexia bacterium]
MLHIAEVTTAEQLDSVRDLMRAFVAWHRRRHGADLALIDRYFDAPAFEAELAALPGKYDRPWGRLLLAAYADQPAGCVALRELAVGVCEMKRMFVYPQLQGKGIGRALAESLIAAARSAGYAAMRLDTSVRQAEALHLYRRLGFQRIDPYYELAPDLQRWLIFMELRLA